MDILKVLVMLMHLGVCSKSEFKSQADGSSLTIFTCPIMSKTGSLPDSPDETPEPSKKKGLQG